MKKEIIIDGNNFSNLEEFYDEIENKFTKNLDWKIGRNLDALDDVFTGGFNVYEYEEVVKVIWKNVNKSKNDLSAPSGVEKETLFETILDIIKGNKHIELVLE